MKNDHDFEKLITQIDWNATNEKDRADFGLALITREAAAVGHLQAAAAYSSRITTLIATMVFVLACAAFSVAPGVTLISLVGMHMLLAILSKLAEMGSKKLQSDACIAATDVVKKLSRVHPVQDDTAD